MSEDTKYYDRFAQSETVKPEKEKTKRTLTGEAGLSIAKVFGYMFAGLLITASIVLGLGALYRYVFKIDASLDINTKLQQNAVIALLAIMIVSMIAVLVMSFVVPIKAVRGKSNLIVPSILYSVFMGLALSSLAVFIDWSILGVTFGITSLVFGVMALIALISKGRLNGLAIAAMGLFFGAGILALVLWILMLFGFFSGTLYWIISFAVFAAVMLITIWDMARIKAIAQKGEMATNVSLYCAYVLYNDFIVIFLRLLYFIMLIMGNRR